MEFTIDKGICGKGAIAVRNIPAGTLIIVEEPISVFNFTQLPNVVIFSDFELIHSKENMNQSEIRIYVDSYLLMQLFASEIKVKNACELYPSNEEVKELNIPQSEVNYFGQLIQQVRLPFG